MVVNIMPRPLGDGFEYLGKKDFGNLIIGDSKPYSVYYYGTDMTVEEMRRYFNGIEADAPVASGPNFSILEYKNNDTEFHISYHYDKTLTSFQTTKKVIISVEQSHYKVAKKFLK